MRGKTNILPMVGGYIDAPVENYVAGENLQIGDLVQKSYSDAAQQIVTPISKTVTGLKPLKLYDGKLVYFLNTSTVDVKVSVVTKGVSLFTASDYTLFSVASNQGKVHTFVPVNDRTFIVFARTGYGNESYPYAYYCKKVVYNGLDFNISDISYNIFPNMDGVTSSTILSRAWCFGNGGTLFSTYSKAYYLTIVNDELVLYEGNRSAYGHLVYLPQQDLFLNGAIGNPFSTVSYQVVTFRNGVLTISDTISTTICGFEVFDDYIVGFGVKNVNDVNRVSIQIATVDNSGIIDVFDEYATEIQRTSYNTYEQGIVIPYEGYFVAVINKKSTSSPNGIDSYYKVFYYNNGFSISDEKSSRLSGDYYIYTMFWDYTDDGFMYNYFTNGYNYQSDYPVIFSYQQMRGDKFASPTSNFTVVKARGKIEGVVKRGGNSGDSVEVFVPQLSS